MSSEWWTVYGCDVNGVEALSCAADGPESVGCAADGAEALSAAGNGSEAIRAVADGSKAERCAADGLQAVRCVADRAGTNGSGGKEAGVDRLAADGPVIVGDRIEASVDYSNCRI